MVAIVRPGTDITARPFAERLLPAVRGGGFAMDGYWVWCGSVIRGDDGRYHMFASRIPKGPAPDRPMGLSPHWLFASEVVRADSDTPEGPYAFREVVLPRRHRAFFDGMSTHNPTIRRAPDGTYLLYYLGVTYDDHAPDPADPSTWIVGEVRDRRYNKTWANKRIGMASAPSVFGPWTRRDEPLMRPRPGRWDAVANTNPAPLIHPDGSVLMLYKSRSVEGGNLLVGAATAPHWSGPYSAAGDAPGLSFDDPACHVEDPYLWHEGGRYHAVMKDMTGGITGEHHAGLHATSTDGLRWRVAGKAYSRTVQWDDGTTVTQGSLERPQLLIDESTGRPTHLFAACADGPGGFWNATRTWNACVPLST